jgi:hypothetical protein
MNTPFRTTHELRARSVDDKIILMRPRAEGPDRVDDRMFGTRPAEKQSKPLKRNSARAC